MDSEVGLKRDLQEQLVKLSQEAKELYLYRSVPELGSAPTTALTFHRDWVAHNRPVLFKGAVKHWKAFKEWNEDYLRNQLGSKEVTVALTPTGYADAITPDEKFFVMPHEASMTMADFLDRLKAKPEGVTHYIQKQNSNLTDEFASVFGDVSELEWASETFGKKPDAVNFWMGDGRCVTSTHKDPYENIYCVVRGYKDITLHPPTDFPWLYYKKYQPAVYAFNPATNSFTIEPCSDMAPLPWISVDPLKPDLEAHPNYANASPITVRVNEGDALYLPSLWFHHLRQSHGCVAVNFWYDMEFDVKFNYFENLLSGVSKLLND